MVSGWLEGSWGFRRREKISSCWLAVKSEVPWIRIVRRLSPIVLPNLVTSLFNDDFFFFQDKFTIYIYCIVYIQMYNINYTVDINDNLGLAGSGVLAGCFSNEIAAFCQIWPATASLKILEQKVFKLILKKNLKYFSLKSGFLFAGSGYPAQL